MYDALYTLHTMFILYALYKFGLVTKLDIRVDLFAVVDLILDALMTIPDYNTTSNTNDNNGSVAIAENSTQLLKQFDTGPFIFIKSDRSRCFCSK